MDVESGGGEFITVADVSLIFFKSIYCYLHFCKYTLFFQTPSNGLSAKIDGLRPGHLYQFEVYAINKEGLSLPIRTKDPIKAENPYSE